MRADLPPRPWGIPDFGAVAQRPRLLQLLHANPPGVTLIVAPSGFGKSVLAAQYVRSLTPGVGFWFDSSQAAHEPASVLRRVASELNRRDGLDEGAESGVRALQDDSEDLVSAVAKAVARLDDPRQVVVVLDDFPELDAESARHLAALGGQLKCLGSHLVVTARALSSDAASVLHDAAVVDGDDMRLSISEAALIASEISGVEVGADDVSSLCDLCAGHPATFVVLFRHANAGPDGWTPRSTPSIDLRSRLTYLASTSLSASEQQALLVMALLGRGTLPQIRACGVTCSVAGLTRIGSTIPLVRLAERSSLHAPSDEFMMHELAQDVFSDKEFMSGLGPFGVSAWPRAVEILVQRGETPRAAVIVEAFAGEEETVDWLLHYGEQVLRLGGSSCLVRMVKQLPVTSFIRSPRLLLVHARILQEHSAFEEAIEKANVARTIAEQDGDEVVVAEAMLVAGECYSETAKYEAALGVLDRLVARPSTGLTSDQKAWAFAAIAGCCLHLGLEDDASSWANASMSVARECASSESVRSYVLGVAGAIATLVRGDLGASLAHFTKAAESSDVPRALQAKAQGNKAVCLCEMGRLDRCVEAVHLSLTTCSEADRGITKGAFLPVEGAALVAQGSVEAGLRKLREGIEMSADVGDRYQSAYNRIYLATLLRAVGRIEESLVEAEHALETFTGVAAGTQSELATLELAASLLALDDVAAATRAVESVRSAMTGLNLYHFLRADMILAEMERRADAVDKAVARLMSHEEYLLTESANWQVAMYCRAFPELLGLFALALGTERLPAHLLRMIPPENAEVVLVATRDLLEPAEWTRLGERLLGKEGLAEYLSRGGRPLCRVRLFGGLEVNVGGRVVSEREWRKRKARLLFTMLVSHGGRDVPRDQVLEHLWPEMDESRAKNNLYVIWSAMKNALSPEADKNEACPFIDNTGGVCRVVAESVRSDIEEFDQVLGKAREARTAERPAEALRLYERLAEIYRGELLPGDVYDDWFAQIRDEYRASYADAMLQATSILRARGDHLGALTFVRRALSRDPWREDLYQAALSCQIAAGQRSAAIETYLACRTRLSEDLGLEPSAETRALYDQILAMEDRPTPRSSWPGD